MDHAHRTLKVVVTWTPPKDDDGNSMSDYLETSPGDYVLVKNVAAEYRGWVAATSFSQYRAVGYVPAWILQGVQIKITDNTEATPIAGVADLEGSYNVSDTWKGRLVYVKHTGVETLFFNDGRWELRQGDDIVAFSESKGTWWPIDCKSWVSSSQRKPLMLSVTLDKSKTFPVSGAASLPIHQCRDEIVHQVKETNLMVVEGNTGTGKSTWVPVHLMEAAKEEGLPCRIFVTQPRRLAATSLAERVAYLTNTKLGSVAGYRIGGGNHCDYNARIVFTTVGYLVSALIHNSETFLDDVTHVVLDEVHERSLDADFLSMLLKLLLSRPARDRCTTRLVVMSATLQVSFASYFLPLMKPSLNIQGSNGKDELAKLTLPCVRVYAPSPFPVEEVYWEDLTRWSINADFPMEKLEQTRDDPLKLSIACSQLCESHQIPVLEKLLYKLWKPHVASAVLVFLPGLTELEELSARLSWSKHKYLLHSELPEAGEGVSDDLGAEEFRIILATNIAESSLTLPSLTTVIDCGLHRTVIFDHHAHMSTLVTKWCSKASLTQRRGRTGRVCPGINIRLFPRSMMQEFSNYEMCASEGSELTKVVLRAAGLVPILKKIHGAFAGATAVIKGSQELNAELIAYDAKQQKWLVELESWSLCEHKSEDELQVTPITASELLALLPTAPPPLRVKVSMEELRSLDLLCPDEKLTKSGQMCMQLPVDVILGRMIWVGQAVFGSMVDAAILAAAMSLHSCDVYKNPYSKDRTMYQEHLKLLYNTVRERDSLSERYSEPLVLRRLLLNALSKNTNGRYALRNSWRFSDMLQGRAWKNFTDKLLELMQSLAKSCPTDEVTRFNDVLNRGGLFHEKQNVEDDLVLLIGLSLAPGHVVVGQSEALIFCPEDELEKNCVIWKGDENVLRHALPPRSRFDFPERNVLHAENRVDLEYLYRISQGKPKKETEISLGNYQSGCIKPCSHDLLNRWFMIQPWDWELGVRKRWRVAVMDWKSRAFTIASKHRKWAIASGAEGHWGAGEWVARLRGVTILPDNLALPLIMAGRPARKCLVICDEAEQILGVRIGNKIVPGHLSSYFLDSLFSYRYFYTAANSENSTPDDKAKLRKAYVALIYSCRDPSPKQHGRLRLRVLNESLELVPIEPYEGETRPRPKSNEAWFHFATQEWTEDEWEVNQEYLSLDDPYATVQKELCTECEDAKPRIAFSSSQWMSPNRKCRECFEAFMAENEGMTCTICGVKKNRDEFTKGQRSKPKTRKCIECQEKRGEVNENEIDDEEFPSEKERDMGLVSKAPLAFILTEALRGQPVYADRAQPAFDHVGQFGRAGGYVYAKWHVDERKSRRKPTFYSPFSTSVTILFFEDEFGLMLDENDQWRRLDDTCMDMPEVSWATEVRPKMRCAGAIGKTFSPGIIELPQGKYLTATLPLIFFTKTDRCRDGGC